MEKAFLLLFITLTLASFSKIFAAIPLSPPVGYLDLANCTQAAGWTCKQDEPNTALRVRFYVDGLKGTGTYIGEALANLNRETAVGNLCNGNSYHGFSFNIPNQIKTNNVRSIYAYGVRANDNHEELLTNSPKYINCIAPTRKPTLKPTPMPTPVLIADINLDCKVDAKDYDIFTKNFGKKNPLPDIKPDLNRDGIINVLDYAILFENFGKKCNTTL